jgi:hypothetical protein
MMIEQVRCPRCGIRRVGNFGSWGRYCFNCRLHLPARNAQPPTAHAREPRVEVNYLFEPAEVARLEHHRAAVLAGFYTDWPDTIEIGSGEAG